MHVSTDRWFFIGSLIKRICLVLGFLCPLGSAVAQDDTGRGRHKQFYVTPLPGKVVIDGVLDDWDLSGQIEMFVIDATRDTQSAKIAAMYDDDAFFLSGEITDLTPMLNRHDPEANTDKAWNADAVQFRLTLDPEIGYPVRETTFQYKGKDAQLDTRDDIVHLQLWHYTDDASANLSMQVGMSYRIPRPDWLPDGLVPLDKFQGSYRKWDSGLGYNFEYRIPWSTLGTKRPLTGGDRVAGTVNVLWSRPDGLAHIRATGAAYDIMGETGFPFQKTESWGRVIFSKTGKVPKALVDVGLPSKRELPLEFAYDLPEAGETTIQLFKPDGTAVRILVPQETKLAGQHLEPWDGLDDRGRVLPAGEYRWRGVVHDPVKAKYRFSVHNSGQPPYTTIDAKGGWGGDHGVPQDVVALKDGMLLVWDSAEFGSGTIRVDLEGKKQWGTPSGGMFIATDGPRYYTAGDRGFYRGMDILMYEVETSRLTRLENGVRSFSPPPGGDEDSNQPSGLAWLNDTLYVSYRERDLVALFSTVDGSLKAEWSVPTPGRLAVRPDGTMAVISGNTVMSMKNGVAYPWLTTHLDQPKGLAVATDGTAYVTNQGALQAITVFANDGGYLRSIGKNGGRPLAGSYDTSGMLSASGVGLDPKGRLWVAEAIDAPKRISVWDTADGAFVKEFFGAAGYFAYGFIDPDRPGEIYAENAMWDIDWETYMTRPTSTVWRQTHPNMMTPPGSQAYQGIPRIVTTKDGTQYMYGNTRGGSILLRRDGDLFKPFAALLWVGSPTGIALVDDHPEKWLHGRKKRATLLWQDADNDQVVQEAELTLLPANYPRVSFAWLKNDLTAHLSNGVIWRPVSVSPNGQYLYDPESAVQAVAAARPGYMALTEDGSVLTLRHGEGPSLVKHLLNGDIAWNYPDLIFWKDSLDLPTVKAGSLWAMTGMMGVAGEFFAHQTYRGVNQIFRTDGQYIGAILNDRRAVGRGPYAGQSEGQGGSFVKLTIDGRERYFAIGGSNDVRVWEVLGLDTIRDLPGGIYVHTEEQVAKAQAALAPSIGDAVESQEIVIVSGGKAALDGAPVVTCRLEGGQGFDVRVSYDSEMLYLRFNVRAAQKLVNFFPDERILFRGGNLLDIQLATDPSADPYRKKPAPGDKRLLVSRQKGKPFSVLFEPKVAGFVGEPIVLTSPTGKESFDRITVVKSVGLDYAETATGFTATLAIPQKLLGLAIKPCEELWIDLGYVFGNTDGTRTAARGYVFNRSFSANIVDDIPHESRLEPAEWGRAKAVSK